MKKLIIIAVGILLSIVTVYLVLEYYPKEFQLHAQGVKYRLGTDLSEQLVDVNIEGKLTKSWSGERSFRGTIDIEGIEIPVPEEERELNIIFFDNGFGAMSGSQNPVITGNGVPYLSVVLTNELLNAEASRIVLTYVDGASYIREVTEKKGYLFSNPGASKVKSVVIYDYNDTELYRKEI